MKQPRSRWVTRLMYAGTALFFLALILMCVKAWRMGLFNDLDTLQNFVERTGMWAPVIFLLLQVVQILLAFIPGGILLIGGVVIFGPWLGLFYNFLGTLIGSCLNFYLARRWGQPLVRNLMEDKTREKYFHWLDEGKKFDRLFAIAIFLPFFPDDALCLVAGLSKMSWKRFLCIMLLKLPVISVYSILYLTAGQILLP